MNGEFEYLLLQSTIPIPGIGCEGVSLKSIKKRLDAPVSDTMSQSRPRLLSESQTFLFFKRNFCKLFPLTIKLVTNRTSNCTDYYCTTHSAL